MGTTIRAGDLFAGRYRLTVLLDESGNGRFWRARDEVLARSVALHLVDRSDARADALLDAARRSARVQDRRLLRVLDADLTDEYCYVVNEWGEGLSLDLRLADQGPLSPRRAAWIVSEFADTLAKAHAVGEVHGRVAPENLLVDRHQQVRVIGFAVDAALRGEDPGTAETDVADAGALLYAALTGRWAGRATSQLPAAPRDHGQVMRARQVQAGVPRTLDLVCEDLVSGTGKSRVTHSAQGLSQLLAAFVGDAQDLMHPEPERPHRDVLQAPTRRGDGDAPDQDETQRLVFVPSDLPSPEPVLHPEPEPPVAPPAAAISEDVPASNFDALEATAEVSPESLLGDDPNDPINDFSWLTPRTDAPPAPQLPEPTARPLFAPEPADGQPQRRGRVEASATDRGAYQAAIAPGAQLTDPAASDDVDDPHWPWDEAETDEQVPGSRWFKLAVLVGVLALVLLISVAVKQVVGSGEKAKETPTAPQTSQIKEPVLLTNLKVTDFDPEGSDGGVESTNDVPKATDGDPETAWRTAGYYQNFTEPARLKSGVGLLVDLGEQRQVSQVVVRVLGGTTSASLYLTKKRPDSVADLKPVGTQTGLETLRFSPGPQATGRWAVVWLTSLPKDGKYYRGQIAELKVHVQP